MVLKYKLRSMRRSSALVASVMAAFAMTIAGVPATAEFSSADKPVPAPAPDNPDEPDFGAYDPGRDAGEFVTSLLTPAGAKLANRELPGLALGIIGVTGDPAAGYNVVIGAETPRNTITTLLDTALPPAARELVDVQASTATAAELRTAWSVVNEGLAAALQGADSAAYWFDIDPERGKVVIGLDETAVEAATIERVEALAPGLIHVELEGPGG